MIHVSRDASSTIPTVVPSRLMLKCWTRFPPAGPSKPTGITRTRRFSITVGRAVGSLGTSTMRSAKPQTSGSSRALAATKIRTIRVPTFIPAFSFEDLDAKSPTISPTWCVSSQTNRTNAPAPSSSCKTVPITTAPSKEASSRGNF
jgi:hypothetical protein